MAVSDQLLLDALLTQARPFLLSAGFRSDSCIMSTAVVLGVCKRLGVDAKPLVVRVRCHNPTYVALIDEYGRDAQTAQEAQEWRAQGAWSVWLGFGPNGEERGEVIGPPMIGRRGWAGHLVAVLRPGRRGGTLVDISLDQASRPNEGMVLAPLAVGVSGAFLRGEESAQVCVGGSRITYTAYAHDTSYTTSPDWLDRGALRRYVEAIVRRVG